MRDHASDVRETLIPSRDPCFLYYFIRRTMMNSMTGFGRGIGESEIGSVTAEIKAVNSRF